MNNNKIQIGEMLCLGYFRSAQLSTEYLLSQKNIGKTFISKDIIKKIPTYKTPFTLENGSAFLAARFNFKHALELSMKSLFSIAKVSVPGGHDLSSLCNKIKITLLNKSVLQQTLDAWEWIIDEYYKKDKFAPNDRNELDRYMFSKDGNKFPYKNIHAVTKKDLKTFLRDIKTAKQLFWSMNSQSDLIKYCKKFNLNPDKQFKKNTKTIVYKLKNGRYTTRRKKGVHQSKMLYN